MLCFHGLVCYKISNHADGFANIITQLACLTLTPVGRPRQIEGAPGNNKAQQLHFIVIVFHDGMFQPG
ncbi:hypothetical protein D9M68_932260 [compost metagenome]